MISSVPIVHLRHLGRLRYLPSLKVQEQSVQLVKEARRKEITEGSGKNLLLVVEHEPVYTTGMRTKVYETAEETRLKSLGADFVRTNRGGLITFHGPGQLVAYPILDLHDFVPKETRKKTVTGMKWYVNTLEQVIIDLCLKCGLKAERSPHTGVWIGDNKVCAMGIHNSDFVTSHGLALNCNIDLNWFSHIVPCGIPDKGVTSLSRELNRDVTIQEMTPLLIECFEKNFCCKVENETKDLI